MKNNLLKIACWGILAGFSMSVANGLHQVNENYEIARNMQLMKVYLQYHCSEHTQIIKDEEYLTEYGGYILKLYHQEQDPNDLCKRFLD